MPFCNSGERAVITYSFNNGKQRVHLSNDTPIDVIITEKYTPNFTGGQCLVSYDVRYEITGFGGLDCVMSTATRTVSLLGEIESIGWEFKLEGGYSPFAPQVIFANAATAYIYHANGQKYSLGGGSGGICQNPNAYSARILSVVRRDGLFDNCGNPKKICELAVKKNGFVLFKDQGQCPCNFNVSCGDCPDGTMRCESSGYPGYCCLPCKEIKSEIASLTRQVRSLDRD